MTANTTSISTSSSSSGSHAPATVPKFKNATESAQSDGRTITDLNKNEGASRCSKIAVILTGAALTAIGVAALGYAAAVYYTAIQVVTISSFVIEPLLAAVTGAGLTALGLIIAFKGSNCSGECVVLQEGPVPEAPVPDAPLLEGTLPDLEEANKKQQETIDELQKQIIDLGYQNEILRQNTASAEAVVNSEELSFSGDEEKQESHQVSPQNSPLKNELNAKSLQESIVNSKPQNNITK